MSNPPDHRQIAHLFLMEAGKRKMLIFRQNYFSGEPFYFYLVVCSKCPKVPGHDFYIT